MNLQFLLPRVPGLGIWQIDTGSELSVSRAATFLVVRASFLLFSYFENIPGYLHRVLLFLRQHFRLLIGFAVPLTNLYVALVS